MEGSSTNGATSMESGVAHFNPNDRRHFIGGSDARFIMGNDEAALLRLWCEKRGEAEPERAILLCSSASQPRR